MSDRKAFVKSCRKTRRYLKYRIRLIGESDIPMNEKLSYKCELLSCLIAEFGGGLAYKTRVPRS